MSKLFDNNRRSPRVLAKESLWIVIGLALVAAPLTAFGQNPDCTLNVPDNALTARGLATPYKLVATDPTKGPCHETDPSQSAFVQAAVLNPQTGQISIYNPLVIDKGTEPAAPPVVPTLPDGAIVAIWFGYNGSNLTLHSGGQCVNGSGGTVFGQFAHCNAPAFFGAAHNAINARKIVIPPLGAANDGRPCPSTRDFAVVDQDPSDNLTTSYLMTTDGRVAQYTQANLANLPGAVKFSNPSDERLVNALLDPALGCTPWTAPDLADPGQMVPALALNELQAGAYQLPPLALVPLFDPMVLNDNGVPNLDKLNAYRRGVDQPTVSRYLDADPVQYCQDLRRISPAKLALDQTVLTGRPSPFPLEANSLFTFLAQRLVATYKMLHCPLLLQQRVPVTLTTNAQGVVVDAQIKY